MFCKNCKEDKSESEFYRRTQHGKLHKECKKCMIQKAVKNVQGPAKKRRELYVRQRSARIGEGKAGESLGFGLARRARNVPCKDCGGVFPEVCMDFDHVRGKKLNAISALKYYGVARVKAELEKCEVVCANCHRVRTQKRRKESKDLTQTRNIG